jgi:hypothetical protein
MRALHAWRFMAGFIPISPRRKVPPDIGSHKVAKVGCAGLGYLSRLRNRNTGFPRYVTGPIGRSRVSFITGPLVGLFASPFVSPGIFRVGLQIWIWFVFRHAIAPGKSQQF